MKYFFMSLGLLAAILLGLLMYFPTVIAQYIVLNGISHNWLKVSSESLQVPVTKTVTNMKEKKSINLNGFIIPQFIEDRFIFFQKNCFKKKSLCDFQYINENEALGDIKLGKFRSQELLGYYPDDKFFQLPIIKKLIETKIDKQENLDYLKKCSLKHYADKSFLNISDLKSFVFDLFCIKLRAHLMEGKEVEVYEEVGEDYIKLTSFDEARNRFEVIIVTNITVHSFNINYEDEKRSVAKMLASEILYRQEDSIQREAKYLELGIQEKLSPMNMVYAYNAYVGDLLELRGRFIELLSRNKKKNKKILNQVFSSEGIVIEEEKVDTLKRLQDEAREIEKDTKLNESKVIEDNRVFGH